MTLRLLWDRAGTGEPLLLLHGIGSTHDDFTALRPRLNTQYRVLAPDLPGHGRSPALPGRPTIAAITAAVVADLDELGVGRVHVLGNSIGARVALELAIRGRARSVVAISPSGLNTPTERLHQGMLMSANRLVLRGLRPFLPALARTTLGRSALLAGMRSTPWRSSEAEAHALQEGFAEADAFWQMLWWGILADVPTGLDRIDCPVVLAQGTADLVAVGQTPRYVAAIAGRGSCPWSAPATLRSPTLPGPSSRSSARPPRSRLPTPSDGPTRSPHCGRPRDSPVSSAGHGGHSTEKRISCAAQTRRRAGRRGDGRIQRHRPRHRPAARRAGRGGRRRHPQRARAEGHPAPRQSSEDDTAGAARLRARQEEVTLHVG